MTRNFIILVTVFNMTKKMNTGLSKKNNNSKAY